jgi:hypothetical protein
MTNVVDRFQRNAVRRRGRKQHGGVVTKDLGGVGGGGDTAMEANVLEEAIEEGGTRKNGSKLGGATSACGSDDARIKLRNGGNSSARSPTGCGTRTTLWSEGDRRIETRATTAAVAALMGGEGRQHRERRTEGADGYAGKSPKQFDSENYD